MTFKKKTLQKIFCITCHMLRLLHPFNIMPDSHLVTHYMAIIRVDYKNKKVISFSSLVLIIQKHIPYICLNVRLLNLEVKSVKLLQSETLLIDIFCHYHYETGKAKWKKKKNFGKYNLQTFHVSYKYVVLFVSFC